MCMTQTGTTLIHPGPQGTMGGGIIHLELYKKLTKKLSTYRVIHIIPTISTQNTFNFILCTLLILLIVLINIKMNQELYVYCSDQP
jgi:hypothetical protein